MINLRKIFSTILLFNLIFCSNFCFSKQLFDDFLVEKLDKNLKIIEKNKIVQQDFLLKNQKELKIKLNKDNPEIEFIPKTDRKIQIKKDVNFSNISELKIKPVQEISTNNKFQEGDIVYFETIEDFEINNKTYKSGTKLKARIETIAKNSFSGVPADIVVGNFSLDNIGFKGEILKTGANRALWVRPCYILTIGFFGAGLIFVFVKGGHAKIRQNEVFIIYY